MKQNTFEWLCVFLLGLSIVVAAIGVAWGLPRYGLYKKQLDGQARLLEAESSKRIAVEEAKAKRESASMLAEAEVARAKGVAEANKIIGESLKGNESYLRYLWIQGLQEGNSEVVYVPTEANLPILEAGKGPR